MSVATARHPILSAVPDDGAAARPTAPVLLLLFVLCVVPPAFFFVAGQRLTFLRIYLLIAFVPLLIQFLSGAAGRIRGADIALMAAMAWVALTFLLHHGAERLGLAAITVVELFGGYLVGRVLVRNEADFRLLIRYVLWVLVLLAPFVVIELFTDRNLLQAIFRTAFSTFVKGASSYGRLGLNRVMAGFEHPILYGLFASMPFAVLFYMYRRRPVLPFILLPFVAFMTFASLSSAPLLAIGVQFFLILWGLATGNRWWLLFGLTVAAYVTVDMLSNRTPITILINYITFDPATAWTRVNIWTFGSQTVLANPIFGIGLNDWARPEWLTGSVDNFWLLMGMRHGLPGVLALIAGLGLAFEAVARARGLPASTADIRTGYLVALVGLYLTLCTVHIWGDTSSFVMAFIGAGLWIARAGEAGGSAAAGTAPRGAPPRTSRPMPGRPALAARASTAPTPAARAPATRAPATRAPAPSPATRAPAARASTAPTPATRAPATRAPAPSPAPSPGSGPGSGPARPAGQPAYSRFAPPRPRALPEPGAAAAADPPAEAPRPAETDAGGVPCPPARADGRPGGGSGGRTGLRAGLRDGGLRDGGLREGVRTNRRAPAEAQPGPGGARLPPQ
jgi:hypothetical protein